MGSLAEKAFGRESLMRAWQALAESDSDHPQPAAIKRFQEKADSSIDHLAEELLSGCFQPDFLTQITLSDSSRTLQVPSVRDRVLARSILDAVTPVIDPVLGPASYAYRPGLGVQDAVLAVASLRDEGLGWVARTDIDDCFPSMPVKLATRMFAALIGDGDVLEIVSALLARRVRGPFRGSRGLRGLAQGCALSPLLTNLVLSSFDEAMLNSGFPLVRYADDIVIASSDRESSWEAIRKASVVVEELGMGLGADKTEITSFAEGFTFLGEDFGPRYPPVTTGRSAEPDKRVVYVATQGGRARISSGRLIVETRNDEQVLDVPKTKVSRLVCFGSVGVSAGARAWAMDSGVDVVFASRRGTYSGTMLGRDRGPKIERLRVQLNAPEGRTLSIARAITEAKIRKQIVVLQNFGRRPHVDVVRDAVAQMKSSIEFLPGCSTPMEIMGVEGASAKAYFAALGQMVPDELAFSGRSRQPPLDVVNAALSFGYTILLGECETALHAAGLDPSIGILHSPQGRRPSLALDLMEEFRPMVVDQVVMRLIRSGALAVKHGRAEPGGSGILLTKAGREAFLRGYEARMLQPIRCALPDFSGTVRRHIHRQAQRLWPAISSDDQLWTGLSWR